MKGALFAALIFALLAFAGAAFRLSTATQSTPPLFPIGLPAAEEDGGGYKRSTAKAGAAAPAKGEGTAASESGKGVGETGAGGAFVEHMKASKDGVTEAPVAETKMTEEEEYKRADTIQDSRESDLQDAKQKIKTFAPK